ncbi:hypothetical protein RUM43_007235 [Polyplax serrata]|uniref:Uncharacterized protein n=1 Tax=Polyplax serrata TaxID=468196 RepID=A0AAN8P5D4_POLSC
MKHEIIYLFTLHTGDPNEAQIASLFSVHEDEARMLSAKEVLNLKANVLFSGRKYQPGEYILKDDLVDNLNIKDEIAKDLGLKDEITSALDQHEKSESSSLGEAASTQDNFLERLDEEPGQFGDSLTENSELIKQISDDDEAANGGDVPSVSLEEALQLVGLEDLEKFKQHLKALGDDPEGSDIEEEEEDFLNEMIQTAQFHPPQTPHPRTFPLYLAITYSGGFDSIVREKKNFRI